MEHFLIDQKVLILAKSIFVTLPCSIQICVPWPGVADPCTVRLQVLCSIGIVFLASGRMCSSLQWRLLTRKQAFGDKWKLCAQTGDAWLGGRR